jgi:hypothetical protein
MLLINHSGESSFKGFYLEEALLWVKTAEYTIFFFYLFQHTLSDGLRHVWDTSSMSLCKVSFVMDQYGCK